MKTVLKDTRERMQKTYESFDSNVSTVRTGRANPAVLNRIQVEYYGTKMPINQVANISSPDPRTLVITPFDKSVMNEIERSIRESDLGFNPNNQGDAVFITVPALNDERRKELVKAVKHMAEEAKVALRNIRRDANHHLVEMEKENELTEDDLRLAEGEVQKLTDEFSDKVDERIRTALWALDDRATALSPAETLQLKQVKASYVVGRQMIDRRN